MATSLPLTIYPNPLLQQKSQPVPSSELRTPAFKQLILDMEQTMHDNNGVGLAAVQVGKLWRLTVINTEDGLLPLINPAITWKSWRGEVGEEGCLSIPGVWGLVKRSKKIRVRALGLDGEKMKFTADGFFARVVQHEIDHLNGVLFIDRTKKINKGDPRYRPKRSEQQNDSE